MRYDLYVVTDEHLSNGLSHVSIAERASSGRANVIQLREKDKSDKELYKIACDIRMVTTRAGVSFIVNDRLDIALACHADGVHLGQDDLPLPIVRTMAPRPFIIGISVGSISEAVKAEEEGADYIAVSPVFSTGSKHDAGPGLGLHLLREIRQVVSVPIVAIGGIHEGNIGEVLQSGADGVAVISAVVSQQDISVAARKLREIIATKKRELQS